jgi:chemotaxis protein methyltransferase CheR
MDNKIDLKLEELQKIGEFMHKATGNKLEDQKLLRFKRKIEDIFLKYNIESFSAFYHQLRFMKSQELLEDLTNALTINETYFWREHEQFLILTQEILPTYVKNNQLSTVRILVAPCSSGEELYSIMLSILDAGMLIEKLNIEIVGIDIDSSMIHKAKKGIFTKRSVSKLPTHLLQTYFKEFGSFYKIDDTLRLSANFMQFNIFEKSLLPKLGTFDIIFSRNMLIYFNAQDKQHSFEIFHSLLKPNGLLFLGHADTNGIDRKLFVPLKNRFHIFKKVV